MQKFLLLGFLATSIAFYQTEYTIVLERGVVNGINKKYVEVFRIDNIKLDRVTKAWNMTVRTAVDIDDIEVETQAYKFASNEYRLFPISYKYNYCQAMKTNLFGGAELLATRGNITDCLFKKGETYSLYNIVPPSEKFPPHMPHGSYKTNVKIFHTSILCANLDIYASIVRN